MADCVFCDIAMRQAPADRLYEDNAMAVWRAVHRVASAVRSALEPDGLNLVQANGAVAFQTVPHFHVHLVPRYAGDPVQLPWIPRPGDPTRIAEVAGRLLAAL